MAEFRLAKSIRITQKGGHAPRIEIDGEVFPFYTANDPKIVSMQRGRLAQVTLTLVAEEVEAEADFEQGSHDAE